MEQSNHNQINVDFLIDSLKQQRNDATDGLAFMHAKYAEAVQMNTNLLSVLNDRDALFERIAELDAEANGGDEDADEAEAETPKPKPKPKPKPNPRGKAKAA